MPGNTGIAIGDIATITNKGDRLEKHSSYRMTEKIRDTEQKRLRFPCAKDCENELAIR